MYSTYMCMYMCFCCILNITADRKCLILCRRPTLTNDIYQCVYVRTFILHFVHQQHIVCCTKLLMTDWLNVCVFVLRCKCFMNQQMKSAVSSRTERCIVTYVCFYTSEFNCAVNHLIIDEEYYASTDRGAVSKQVKLSCNRPWRPIGCETSRI
jgi:hypothetical protein